MRNALSSISRDDFKNAAEARKSFARGIVDQSQLAAFQDMDSLSIVNLEVEKDASTNEDHRRETVRRNTMRKGNNSNGKAGLTPQPTAGALVPKTQAGRKNKKKSNTQEESPDTSIRLVELDSQLMKMSKMRAEMTAAKSPQHRAQMAGKHMKKSNKIKRAQRRTLTNPLSLGDIKSLQHFEAQVRQSQSGGKVTFGEDGEVTSAATSAEVHMNLIHDEKISGWAPTHSYRRPCFTDCFLSLCALETQTLGRSRRWRSGKSSTAKCTPRALMRSAQTSSLRTAIGD
jgi:hypothetical protein